MPKILNSILIIFGIILIGLIGTIVLFFLAIRFLFAGACGNDILSTNDSPNGTYTAYVFARDCGATTSISYQLSILKKDQILENKVGNTFISKEEFGVEWTDDTQLTVTYPTSAETFKMNNKRGKVDIVYLKK